MARVRSCCSNPKRVVLIWALSAFLFFSVFQMLLKNSSTNSAPSSSDASTSCIEQRTRLYDKMSRDLDERGPAFLRHGETSQSLSLSDLFVLQDGVVTPKPKPANPPVRANVLYLSTKYSLPISNAAKNILLPYFDKAIWFQNSSLYHFSMFHASHHISPVPATEVEIEAEATAVKSVAESLCPLKIVLDRVVLTSTGVLLGCWQVTSGTDPATIRAKLRNALPNAPEKQLDSSKTTDEIQLFHELVARLNNQVRGFEAVVSELWYVEELDVLALALNARMKVHRFKLGCSKA